MSAGQRRLSRFTAIFAGGTMISRVLGLVRDIVLAAFIPTFSRDLFIAAFRFPNMLRDMIGEGAANAALLPVMAEAHTREQPEAFRTLVRACLSAMLLVFAAVTLLGILLLPLVPAILSAVQPWTGGDGEYIQAFAAHVPLMQWTFPYLLFIGLSVFAMAPLFTVGHYSTPSWSPALLNVALIAAALLLYNLFEEPAWALVVGVWLGGVAQLFVMFRAMRREVGVVLPNFQLRHPGVRRVFILLLPVILGQATGEVNKLVDTFFAMSLEEGVVTALFYANRLVQLPLAIFGIAVAVAILPELSRARTRGDFGEMREMMMRGLCQSCFLVAPAMLGLMVLAEPIVRLLFEYREFDAEESLRTSTALVYYAAGLLAFAWVKVSVQGFFALQDTKTPVIVATASMLLNILLNVLLVRVLGYRGLALATTLSFTVNFLLLYALLCHRYGPLWDRAFISSLTRIALCTALMAVAALLAHGGMVGLWGQELFLLRLLNVFGAIGVGAGVYLGGAWLLRLEEFQSYLKLLKSR